MSFLYALRLGRWGAIGFGALAFVITQAQAAGFYAIAGHTAAERAAFARSMAQIQTEFAVILPPPLRPDTVAGYVQWRAYGALPIIVAIWALASAAGAMRGDEENRLVEAVLASGVARADALFWRFAAFLAYAVVVAGAAALGYVAGVVGAHDPVDGAGLAGVSLELVALAVVCYALVALVCQLTAARIATACAGALLLGLFLLNSLGRTLDALRPWAWLSPFHLFDASRPLAPGGSLDVRSTEALFAIAALAGLAAALAFSYRDLGAPLWRPPARRRAGVRTYTASPFWRVPVIRSLYDRRVGLLAWAVCVSVVGVLFVELTVQMVKPLLELPGLRGYFNQIIRGDVYPSFLGYIWFSVAQLLVAAFAIAQVARWSAEDVDGRLELSLANPVSRTSVVLERAVVLVIGIAIVVVPAGLAVAYQARHDGVVLDSANLAAATLLLIPFATFFAAAGSLLAAWLPRAAVGVLGGIAFASYLLTQVGPLFKWPTWTLDASPFHLYGQPLIDGVDRTGLAVMLTVSLVGFVASALLLRRRDLGR